jgi:glutamate--cysteine ligase
MNTHLHQTILKNMDSLCEWFEKSSSDLQLPFYSSYDIRDSSFKVTNVDANIYPAGFNNICPTDKEQAPELVNKYFKQHYPNAKKILLLTEDHLKNMYYWENVNAIHELLTTSGFEVRVGMPGLLDQEEIILETYLGNKVKAHRVANENGQLKSKDFIPDVVISNNDFSKTYDNWQDLSQVNMTPPMELGWYQRQKSVYFECYNQVAAEFANILNMDAWFFQVRTELFQEFDVSSETSRMQLAERTDAMLTQLKQDYQSRHISEDPYLFIKNNSGTYGLGVIRVASGEDVLKWSYDSRKKMKAQKGGGRFDEVIIQEGVPTVMKSGAATAEPTIYMIGDSLAGGFLRTHEQKDEKDSLNSPGAVYKKLCLSDLKIKAEGCPLENVYGWVGKMGLLAIGRETQKMNIKYRGYTSK